MPNVHGWTAMTLLVLVAAMARAQESDVEAGDTVHWQQELTEAFEQAKAQDKVLMICVNAKRVAGRNKEEPAAKGLREIIYKDVRVVKRSRDFVCAFLTPSGSSADYGELRTLGIEGSIVSPQHIFVAPAGDRILLRKAYWSFGAGEPGVKALLDMMDEAQAKSRAAPDPEAEAPEVPDAPNAREREAWITRMIQQVWKGTEAVRHAALASLVQNDQEGDCIDRVIAMIADLVQADDEEDAPGLHILTDVIRAIGIDGLEQAAGPISGQLKHDEPSVRAIAAVSLEHIGSKDKKVAKALRSRLAREKDVYVARHIGRALGRCAAGDAKTRQALVKIAGKMDDRDWSFGALIGLAYFEGDAKAARSIERIIQKLGPPRGRRGGEGFLYYTQRALAIWALAQIGDKRSGVFVAETLMEPAEKSNWAWRGRILEFYGAVVRACRGNTGDEVQQNLDGGLRYYLARLSEDAPWKDEVRKGREHSGFEPKADWEVARQP